MLDQRFEALGLFLSSLALATRASAIRAAVRSRLRARRMLGQVTRGRLVFGVER